MSPHVKRLTWRSCPWTRSWSDLKRNRLAGKPAVRDEFEVCRSRTEREPGPVPSVGRLTGGAPLKISRTSRPGRWRSSRPGIFADRPGTCCSRSAHEAAKPGSMPPGCFSAPLKKRLPPTQCRGPLLEFNRAPLDARHRPSVTMRRKAASSRGPAFAAARPRSTSLPEWAYLLLAAPVGTGKSFSSRPQCRQRRVGNPCVILKKLPIEVRRPKRRRGI